MSLGGFFGKRGRVFGTSRHRQQRRLLVESLEDRSLLSGIPFLPQVPQGFFPGSIFGPIFNNSTGAATHIAVNVPQDVLDGVPVTVQLTAQDANNHTVRSFSDSVAVTTSDGSALLPSPVTFQNGVASVQITFLTPGPQTVTAQDTVAANASVTGIANTLVGAPDMATHFTINLPQNATTGVAVHGVVAAYNSENQIVQSYNGTASLTSSDPTITASNLTFKNGLASFQLTFGSPGPRLVTATDLANSLTGALTTTVAAPDVATHYTVLLPQNVPNGKPVQVEILAMDAQNFVVPSYSSAANLAITGGTLSATSVTFKNGFASVQATFNVAGAQTLTVTDGTVPALTTTASTNVAATGAATVPAVATHFTLLMPRNVASGAQTQVWLVALDSKNHVVWNFADSANLAITGGTLSAASVTFKNGFASVQATFNTSGMQSVTATDGSITGTASTNVAAASVATHFTVLLPQNVTSGSPVTVEVLALDANNHLVPSYTSAAAVAVTGATSPPTSATFAGGTASFQVTFSTLGQQTVTVSATGPAISGTMTTTVAAPDVATHFALIIPSNVAAGQPAIIELVALDAQNHVVSNYSGNVTLTSSDGSAKLPTSISFVHGVAHFRVTFMATGPQTLTATDTANSLAITGTTTVANRNVFSLWNLPLLRYFGRY